MYLIALMLICDHWFHAIFVTTIIRQKKKNIGEIEKKKKIEKYSIYVEIVYNSFVHVCCLLLSVVVYVIVSMCVYVMIHVSCSRFEVFS